jgi:hypothetical protein
MRRTLPFMFGFEGAARVSLGYNLFYLTGNPKMSQLDTRALRRTCGTLTKKEQENRNEYNRFKS